jgi:7-carboxy-7-deazaguanine synthase (Cx14CxxC type)
MTYLVKEVFYTLQGEGANTGRAAVFCRFSRCNLWTGREQNRGTAICQFCDTDFVGIDGPGGGRFSSPNLLAEAVAATWVRGSTGGGRPLVVCTGGEPLLQLDEPLVDAFHSHGFEVAVETNGTRPAPRGLDWVCVSPKAGAELVLRTGNELKLVVPQEGIDPDQLLGLDFDHFFVQPMDGPYRDQNTEWAINYCLFHPAWRLSQQTHKYLGIA